MKFEEIPEIIKNAITYLRDLPSQDPEELITRQKCMDIVTHAIQYAMWTMINGDIDDNDTPKDKEAS